MFELKKIGFIKRASALLLDAILLAVLATGFMWIISLICNYSAEEKKANEYFNSWDQFRLEYVEEVADNYGFKYIVSDDGRTYTVTREVDGEEVASSLDTLMDQLVSDTNRSERMEEIYAAYSVLPSAATVNAQYKYVYSLLFMLISLGVLLSYVVLEFVLPIIFKNGQTVGKKVFSICLVRPNCVKITILSLFARTFLGKFAIETMFPILLIFLFLFGGLGVLAIVLFAAITLLNVILFFTTKNKTPIHDALAGTVAVDMKLQMIFQSEEELAEKKAAHKDFFSNSNS